MKKNHLPYGVKISPERDRAPWEASRQAGRQTRPAGQARRGREAGHRHRQTRPAGQARRGRDMDSRQAGRQTRPADEAGLAWASMGRQ